MKHGHIRRGQVWMHSKTGRKYEVVGKGLVEKDAKSIDVNYVPLYNEGIDLLSDLGLNYWRRPLEEWEEIVQLDDGTKVPRFVVALA